MQAFGARVVAQVLGSVEPSLSRDRRVKLCEFEITQTLGPWRLRSERSPRLRPIRCETRPKLRSSSNPSPTYQRSTLAHRWSTMIEAGEVTSAPSGGRGGTPSHLGSPEFHFCDLSGIAPKSPPISRLLQPTPTETEQPCCAEGLAE